MCFQQRTLTSALSNLSLSLSSVRHYDTPCRPQGRENEISAEGQEDTNPRFQEHVHCCFDLVDVEGGDPAGDSPHVRSLGVPTPPAQCTPSALAHRGSMM